MSLIPMTNQPNQTFSVNIPQGSQNVPLDFFMNWNQIFNYWQLTIIQNNIPLIELLPMLCGKGAAGNLLHQYQYLGIGSFFILPASNNGPDSPGINDWGTNFILVWSD